MLDEDKTDKLEECFEILDVETDGRFKATYDGETREINAENDYIRIGSKEEDNVIGFIEYTIEPDDSGYFMAKEVYVAGKPSYRGFFNQITDPLLVNDVINNLEKEFDEYDEQQKPMIRFEPQSYFFEG